MKYGVARDHYIGFSGRASDVARQLAFAGIAAVWLFRPEDSNGLGLPADLMPVALALALSLFFDLFQYIYAAAAWGVYQWWFEEDAQKSNPADEREGDIPDSPNWINHPTIAFFALKLGALAIAYSLFVWWLATKA